MANNEYPEIGSYYLYIEDSLTVKIAKWDGNYSDKRSYDAGNYFVGEDAEQRIIEAVGRIYSIIRVLGDAK